MLTKLSSLWDTLRGSLWFVPSVMAAAAVVLAFTSLSIDRRWIEAHPANQFTWLYGGGADGARDVLSIVASSMITVAGVIFSITVVALTLASQQFGPRLLRSFMRDRGNQVVLGTFISIYLYCLIVLRSVRTEEAGGFVPHMSVSLTLILALVGAGILIYYFHHATSSIRASSVIAAVAADLDAVIDRLFPKEVAAPGPPPEAVAPSAVPDFLRQAGPIAAGRSGYVQAIDTDCLLALAKTELLVIRLDRRPGDFVTRDTILATVFPSNRTSVAVAHKVNEAYVLGIERTNVQDVLFPAEQLAEMAVRALSPSMNDPSTALACIDRLCAAFVLLAGRRLPSPYRYDDQDTLRLIAYPGSLSDLIGTSFNPIREHGRTSRAVTIRLLDTIIRLAPFLRPGSEEARLTLSRQAQMIQRGAAQGLHEASDRSLVQDRFNTVIRALQAQSPLSYQYTRPYPQS